MSSLVGGKSTEAAVIDLVILDQGAAGQAGRDEMISKALARRVCDILSERTLGETLDSDAANAVRLLCTALERERPVLGEFRLRFLETEKSKVVASVSSSLSKSQLSEGKLSSLGVWSELKAWSKLKAGSNTAEENDSVRLRFMDRSNAWVALPPMCNWREAKAAVRVAAMEVMVVAMRCVVSRGWL